MVGKPEGWDVVGPGGAASAPETPAAGPGAPSASRVARLVRDRRTGELRPPKGPGGRGRKGATAEALEAPEPGGVTPEDVAAASLLGATVWSIAAPMFKHRLLNEDETAQLGAALAPIVKKYMPLYAEWQLEINFVVVIFTLARATAPPKEPRDLAVEPEPHRADWHEAEPFDLGTTVEEPRDRVR